VQRIIRGHSCISLTYLFSSSSLSLASISQRCDYSSAEIEFNRALSNDNLSASHYYSRSRSLFYLQRYEHAYIDAEHAITLDPSLADARSFLLQLRQMLLRPADLARARELPPVPSASVPWVMSPTTASQPRTSSSAGAPRRRARLQTGSGQGTINTTTTAASQNGESILALVYGEAREGLTQKFGRRALR
jgi:tetratricopeptide (TPR) repeat protein